MNGCARRQACPEILPCGRKPRESDAHDVARETVEFLNGERVELVALYIQPDGRVIRIVNPTVAEEDSCSLVGVYDEDATEADIVADILEMGAQCC